jgi:hypothetical protein
MKIEHLQQAASILTKCGAQTMQDGTYAVPIYRGFVLNCVLQPGQSATFTREITGNAPWSLRAISCDQSPTASLVGLRVQIQMPNGRNLFGGNGIDISQFSWVGSWRWLQDPELRCEPGSKIQVTLTNAHSQWSGCPPVPPPALAVNFLFEGVCLFFMRGGVQVSGSQSLASALPRYQGTMNENIMAPAWMSSDFPQTPAGYADEYFIYSSPAPIDQPTVSTWTVTAQTASVSTVTVAPDPVPLEVQIDGNYESFFVSRILFDLQLTTGCSAIVKAKIRTGGGKLLNDSAIDMPRYLNGAEFPSNWRVKGGDSVFIDANLFDLAGQGTATLQVFLEGYRRRKL